MSSTVGYRKDIDGLRAVAVLPVVLFHLDVALFSGGFVGVDVFFVISGFLITSILYRDIQAGQFSYGEFYERRIRRLLPALFFMLGVSTVIAWFLFLPLDFRAFSEGLAAAVIFLANIHYWDKTDYFGDPVELIPLLHTWSLAVEEQFYILFPPLLILLMRFWPRYIKPLLCVAFLLSLLSAQYTLAREPEAAFYLVHLRAWELLAGSLLAIGLVPKIRSYVLAELTALAGLALIVASVFLLDKDTSFPGLAAAPAVFGAAMIIHAGSSISTWVARLLSVKMMVWVGLISYSLYLWHWPLFVFVRYYLIEPFTLWQQVALFAVACVLGWMSWRFIERPFRRPVAKGEQNARKKMFWQTATLSLLFIAISLPGMITRGAAFRLPSEIVEISSISKETIPFRRPCFGLSAEDIDSEKNVCTLGGEGEPEFLVWGDSHALSLAHGMDLAAKKTGMVGGFLGKSVCPAVLETQDFMASEVRCSDFNDAAVRYLQRHPLINHVVLVGVWSIYKDKSTQGYEVSFAAGLEKTLALLNAMDVKVTLIDQVPKIAYDVPSVLARVKHFGTPLELRTARLEHVAQVEPFRKELSSLAEKYTFTVVNLDDVYCDDLYCNVALGGRPLYRDSHHLSAWGSEQAVDALSRILVSRLSEGRHAANR